MDPRSCTLGQRPDNRSDLLKALAKIGPGEKVNVCPFGCLEEELDGHGYCRHLVGFTNNKETYEPMRVTRHGRKVEVPMVKDELATSYQDATETMPVMKPAPPPCEKGDVFIQISTSWRVYRKVAPAKKIA